MCQKRYQDSFKCELGGAVSVAALRVPRTFKKLNAYLRAQGGVNGEDKVRESSHTEVPPPIEPDTEELGTERGCESVDWNFFWL